MYVQLNLGRGVEGEGPLTETEWADFQDGAALALQTLAQDVGIHDYTIERHYGQGAYLDHSEESAHISLLSPVKPPLDYMLEAFNALTKSLKDLAAEYHQHSIGLVQSSRLIKA